MRTSRHSVVNYQQIAGDWPFKALLSRCLAQTFQSWQERTKPPMKSSFFSFLLRATSAWVWISNAEIASSLSYVASLIRALFWFLRVRAWSKIHNSHHTQLQPPYASQFTIRGVEIRLQVQRDKIGTFTNHERLAVLDSGPMPGSGICAPSEEHQTASHRTRCWIRHLCCSEEHGQIRHQCFDQCCWWVRWLDSIICDPLMRWQIHGLLSIWFILCYSAGHL